MHFISIISTLLIAPVLVLSSIPNSNFQQKRKAVDKLDAGDVITCGKGAELIEHDCNVAFLQLGGGIAGKIQFLKFNGPKTTGVFGTCQFTATAIDGGNTINASKGRLEHGQEPMLAQCGPVVGSTVKIIGGSNNGGNVLLAVSAAPTKANACN